MRQIKLETNIVILHNTKFLVCNCYSELVNSIANSNKMQQISTKFWDLEQSKKTNEVDDQHYDIV